MTDYENQRNMRRTKAAMRITGGTAAVLCFGFIWNDPLFMSVLLAIGTLVFLAWTSLLRSDYQTLAQRAKLDIDVVPLRDNKPKLRGL